MEARMNAPFIASELREDNKKHLLLASSGSVATIKLPSIISALSHYGNLSIRIILTSSASQFLAGQSAEQPGLSAIASLPNVDGVYQDADEWAKPWVRGDHILHIELRRWADLLVIAPLSANTMAKLVGGLCDNLLLSTVRAWDTIGGIDPPRFRLDLSDGEQKAANARDTVLNKKIILVAPAMNTAMWEHPITRQHMKLLEGDWNVWQGGWIEVLRPVEKQLACGDTGDGAMKNAMDIVAIIEKRLRLYIDRYEVSA